MDNLTRLRLRYRNPAMLGLSSGAELTNLLGAAATAGSYEAALLPLVEAELAVMRQQVEELKSASGATIVQGLAARLASLEAEYLRLQRATTGGGAGFRIVHGGAVSWIPDPRQQLVEEVNGFGLVDP